MEMVIECTGDSFRSGDSFRWRQFPYAGDSFRTYWRQFPYPVSCLSACTESAEDPSLFPDIAELEHGELCGVENENEKAVCEPRDSSPGLGQVAV